jgi:catechol 2,3-dioxygenase-like lactoylglutathione lyase family enzyme
MRYGMRDERPRIREGEVRVLSTSDVVAFVSTAAPERARDFYQRVLGLTLRSDDPFALVFDANGVTLRVSKTKALTPAPYTVLGWRVADVRAIVSGLAAQGVAMERFPGLDQDDLGIWAAPGGPRVAWFKDPDGNLLSVTQL